MNARRLFDPGDAVMTFNGEAGLVLSKEAWVAAKIHLKEGKRPGRHFAAGCCHHPDYITQVPVLFPTGTFDVMRGMNIKKVPGLSGDKRRILEELLSHLNTARKEGEMEECVFCKIVNGEIPCFKVYEDGHVLAFEDINPVTLGHTLIIPKKHAKDLWEITEEDLKAIHLASKKVAVALRKALGAKGIACLQLNGEEVNQVVPHYHMHLIPRRAGDPELPVSSWEVRQGDAEEIRRTAERIASALGDPGEA